jgi:hypothetical protein
VAGGWEIGNGGRGCTVLFTFVRTVSAEAMVAARAAPTGFAGRDGCEGSDEPDDEDCSICRNFASIFAILSSVLHRVAKFNDLARESSRVLTDEIARCPYF